jgi:hypothetical protein
MTDCSHKNIRSSTPNHKIQRRGEPSSYLHLVKERPVTPYVVLSVSGRCSSITLTNCYLTELATKVLNELSPLGQFQIC